MIRLSPHLLVATAGALIDLETGDDDARLIHRCGYWSHFDHRSRVSSWPVPLMATVQQLADFGRGRNVLAERAVAGDLFLQWSPAKDAFVRAGIVACVAGVGVYKEKSRYVDVLSIEGGGDDFWGFSVGPVRELVRRLSADSGDRFLRWTDLDRYTLLGSGLTETPESAPPATTDETMEVSQ
jgi:hypothetical protein